MLIWMVVFKPFKSRKLKAGTPLVLPLTFHINQKDALNEAKSYSDNKEGYYAVEVQVLS